MGRSFPRINYSAGAVEILLRQGCRGGESTGRLDKAWWVRHFAIMPYLNIQTNQSLAAEVQEKLMLESSKIVADGLGKSEEFMMVSVKDETPMVFGGAPGPTAFLEIKSVGIPGNQTKEICRRLCEIIQTVAEIPPERVYVKFNDVQRSMWGWKGDMLG